MALTWQNVAAPNFSGAAQARQISANALASGFQAAQAALQNFDQTRLAEAKYQDDHRRALLGDETVRINNEGAVIGNQAKDFALSTAKRDDSLAQDRLAMQPQAAKILGDARLLAGSGDPLKIEQARTMINDNRDTLLKAGWKADAIPDLLDAERKAGTNAFGYKQDVLANDKFWEAQGVSTAARDRANKAINSIATPEAAIRSIQDDTSITDPRIKAQAIKVISEAADAKIFSTPRPEDALLLQATPKPVVNMPAVTTNNQVQTEANPLIGLVDKHEGAGNYDTLFAHAQKNDSPFSGVKVSTMTLGQLNQLDRDYGPWVKQKLAEQGQKPRIATPMGRFQIVGDTRRAAAKEMGLDENTVFDENTQNAMFNHLVDKRISGPKTMDGKIAGLRAEWEGFKNVSDAQLASAINAYESGDRSAITSFTKGDPNAPSPALNVPQPDQANQLLTAAATPKAQLQIGGNQSISDLLTQAATPAQASLETSTPTAAAKTEQNVYAAKVTDSLSSLFGGSDSESPDIQAATKSAADALVSDAKRTSESSKVAAVPASTADNTTPVVAPADNTPVVSDPKRDVQNQLDMATINKVFNGNSLLTNALIKAGDVDMTPDQAAADLVKDGGLMPSGNQQAALAAIKQTMEMAPGIKPAMAAVLVANNAESRDLRASWDWLHPVSSLFGSDGDLWSTNKENLSSATRTNMDGVKANLDQLGLNVAGSIDLAKAVGGIQSQRTANTTQATMGQVQQQLLTSQAQAGALVAAIQRGQDTPENRAELARIQQVIAQLQAIINAGGATTNYIDAQKDLQSQ